MSRFQEYQHAVARTAAPYDDTIKAKSVFGLGIAGEAGEVADLIKKEVGHGHPENREKVLKELGDVLWYVAAIASVYELRLSDIADANIEKLKKRYPEGFSTERSINRGES